MSGIARAVTETRLGALDGMPSHYASSPAAFDSWQLAAFDFDGTQALTNEPGPMGMNVERASLLAVTKVLGADALYRYLRDGGLKNRAPGQVIDDLKTYEDPVARTHAIDDFIAYKLGLLTAQVGKRLDGNAFWPRPVPGFTEAWDRLQGYQQEGGRVNTAIVSSGHTGFIEKFYDLNGLPLPQVVVTEDTIRTEVPEADYGVYVKPGARLMELVHAKWAALHGLSPQQAGDMAARTVYVGDDPVKDGGLARNSGASFVRILPDIPEASWHQVTALVRSRLTEGQDV